MKNYIVSDLIDKLIKTVKTRSIHFNGDGNYEECDKKIQDIKQKLLEKINKE